MITLILILTIVITYIVSLLFVAGQLIRRRMCATEAGIDESPRPLLDNLKGLEDALVDFFASSKVPSMILSVLAAHRKPIRFKKFVRDVRATEAWRGTYEDMPGAAIRAVLTILQVAQLTRMSRIGFEITEIGREV